MITTNYFKSKLSIDLPDDIVYEAIELAKDWLYNLVTAKKEFIVQYKKDKETIRLEYLYPVADDMTNEFGIEDVKLFQYDNEYNIEDISNRLQEVSVAKFEKFSIVKLKYTQEIPDDNYQLKINFNVCYFDYKDKMYQNLIRKILVLKTFNFIKDDIMIMLNQQGIQDFSFNGVGVTVDNNSMKELVETNEQQIKNYINDMMPIRIRPVYSYNMRGTPKRRM